MYNTQEAFEEDKKGSKLKPAQELKEFNCKYIYAIVSGEDKDGKKLYHYLNDRNEAAGPDSFGNGITWVKYE